MAQFAEPGHRVPTGNPIPDGAVPLASILVTGELSRRISRPPDFERENKALAALASALADSPGTILQALAETVLEVLQADSAGLSLLTEDETRFYWAAIAGAWRPHTGNGTPRNFGPCGDVLDRNAPMLFTHWERRYPYLSDALPLADEGLLVPFFVSGKGAGTIWAIAHDDRRRFDAEDLRLLESMGRFGSAAYQAVRSIENLKARSELARVARATSMGVLTASIAHELNQPLSGIITNAHTCLRMLAHDCPDIDAARETARRTIRDADRASVMIARLRALFTHKESTNELVDLNEATQEIIALSSGELQRNRIALQAELADNLPAIIGDRIQLQQVILNLLRNASDAMVAVNDRPRQLLIRTERGSGDYARVVVRDTGVGVDRQTMDKLFDAFYTTKHDGMGIGLSISRSIVERHHGRLWAEPNDGSGATFSFSIPRARESAGSGTDGEAQAKVQRVTRRSAVASNSDWMLNDTS